MVRDPEFDFTIARRKLVDLWDQLIHVVQKARMIVRHLEAGRPVPDSPPEMMREHDALLGSRTECLEAFKVGLEPTSEKDRRLRYGDLSPYSLY